MTQARASLMRMADGDGRAALTLAEEVWRAARKDEIFGAAQLQDIVQRRAPIYDKAQDGHYNLISALHKSVRGSDPDAALYYLCRMLDAGEPPLYIARRVVRMAIEDIGLADPQALVIANAAKDAYDFLGSPGRRTRHREAVLYVATAPKSNAGYAAYGAAMRAAKEAGSLLPPKHILNAPTKLMKEEGYGRGYAYDHDAGRSLLRPELFSRRAAAPALLQSARTRLRTRDQEAAGLLGEAAQRAGRGMIDLDAYCRGSVMPARAPTLDTLRALHCLQPQAIAFENSRPLLSARCSSMKPSLQTQMIVTAARRLLLRAELAVCAVLRGSDLSCSIRPAGRGGACGRETPRVHAPLDLSRLTARRGFAMSVLVATC